MSLRVLIYDRTRKQGEFALRSAWASGARVYRGLGRIDASYGATSWSDALSWLAGFREGESISQVQYWGHGKWGAALIAEDAFTSAALAKTHAHADALKRVQARMLPNAESLIWFRTCETVGAKAGHDFAMGLSDLLGARVAGHTYVIGALQSGLHGLKPGARPHWSETEGLKAGTPESPKEAFWSKPDAPHTIHFMNNEVPAEWFSA